MKFLTTLPDARDRAYGKRLLEGLRSLFAVIHRRADLSAGDFQSQLEAARARVLRLGTHDVPATRACLNSSFAVKYTNRVCAYRSVRPAVRLIDGLYPNRT